MPIADNYGQNVPIATLTDAPNIQTATEGIVNNLVPRSVMTFASASVRGATITAPTEGMCSWLKDVNRLDVYNGSTWVTIAAGASNWTTVTLASGWTQNGNSNGTFQYKLADLNGDRTLFFRGAITKNSWSGVQPDYIITGTPLPAEACPTTRRTINIPCSDAGSTRISLKMDVETTGHLHIYGTSSVNKPEWIGFNGTFVSL